MSAGSAPQRRRPRRGSVERPINGRTYRGTWLLVGIPLLIAAFSVRQPTPLPRASLPPAFDGARALQLARDFAGTYPNRRPGSPGAQGAAEWVRARFAEEGFQPRSDRFRASVPGAGRVPLTNITASAPGRSSDAIVVLAHRDDTGEGPGADDNASGTAALVELARVYGAERTDRDTGATRYAGPAHTIVFLSTDGGAYGWAGVERFLAREGTPARLVAVVNLDAVGRPGVPRIELAGTRPRSAAASLVKTASARVLSQTGRRAETPPVLAQLVDLGFPFGVYEHAPFVDRGVPAITITTGGERPPDAATDTPRRLDRRALFQVGRSTYALVGSVDQAAEVARGTSTYLYLGSRILPGWAVQLVLVAALLPFLVTVVDLFARGRRRRLPLGPALESYRSRLLFWAWVGGLFALFAVAGAFGGGPGGTPPPGVAGAGDWPVLALLGLAVLAGAGWLVTRDRLLPRRPIAPAEELAGATAALLALAVVSLVVAAVNPFALLFVLPSAHAWLWLPQVRHERPWFRAAVLVVGFAGPALLVASFAVRFGLGFDAPWYVVRLVAEGDASIPLALAFLAWLAVAGQLAAFSAGRYAPYPRAAERPPRGPVRQALRRVLVGSPARARPAQRRRATG